VKSKIQSRSAWILVRIQIVIANLDPEVLQWPGGTLIAPLLWFQVMARPFLGVLTETTGKRRDRTFAYASYLEKLQVGTEVDAI
jgi:hypothetical protein